MQYIVMDISLSSLANTIREKGKTIELLLYDTEFVGQINSFDKINKQLGSILNKITSEVAFFTGCTDIPSYAFAECNYLTEVVAPACKKINSAAFLSCNNLVSVSFPLCENVGESVFKNCKNLKDISFPLCKKINDYVFQNCKSLESISLPACTRIENSAFLNCENLSTINLQEYPLVTQLAASGAFNNTNLTSIIVFSDQIENYKNATNWVAFKDKIFN